MDNLQDVSFPSTNDLVSISVLYYHNEYLGLLASIFTMAISQLWKLTSAAIAVASL